MNYCQQTRSPKLCCHRGHYPKDVGLWITDSESHHIHGTGTENHGCLDIMDHLHIVLPPSKDQEGTVCIHIESGTVMAGWNNFRERIADLELKPDRLQIMIQDTQPGFETEIKIRDLFALLAAEGGEVSKENLLLTLDEWITESGVSIPYNHEYTPGPTRLWPRNGLILKQPEAPEYHEWLVMQAKGETKDKQMEGVLREFRR